MDVTEHVANLTMTATSVGQSQLGDDVIDVLFAQRGCGRGAKCECQGHDVTLGQRAHVHFAVDETAERLTQNLHISVA